MVTEKILIYDSNASGHLPDFIEYLIDYLHCTDKNSKKEYYFFLNNKTILELLKNDVLPFPLLDKIHIEKIDANWQKKIDSEQNMILKTLVEKKYLESICNDKKIAEIIFLQIDAYQLIIGLWQNSVHKNILITGILLHPFCQTPIKYNFVFLFNYLRKKFQMYFFLRNKSIKNVYILNDNLSANLLNSEFKDVFRFLPDPIRERNYQKINIRQKYNINENKQILLMVGGIQKRKNIMNIIKAVEALEETVKEKICLLILGKSESSLIQKEIEEEIKKIEHCQIVFKNCFIDNNEFESAIEESKILFTIYSDFYCSSGILGNGAKHNKFIIGSNFGVIGNYIKKYNLGETTNPNDIYAISSAIKNGLMLPKDFEGHRLLSKSNNYLRFSELLLN